MAAAEAVHLPIELALAKAQAEGIAPNVARWLDFIGHCDGEWLELQALNVKFGQSTRTYFNHVRVRSQVVNAVQVSERQHDAQGLFFIANQILPAVATRKPACQWHPYTQKGEGTSDADIAARRVLFVDTDALRPKMTSASEEEMARTVPVAAAIYERFAEILEGDDALGVGHSGNGRAVLVALDRLAEKDAGPLIKGVLLVLDKKYSGDGVEIDTSVCDAKRLLPCWGSIKRKGAPDIEDRPHRRTAFARLSNQPARALSLQELETLYETLLSDLGDTEAAAVRREVDKARGIRTPPQPAPAGQPARSGENPFRRANELAPVEEVLDWLGLRRGRDPVCPACELSDSGVAVVGNGLKCSHDRCSQNGYAGGFRTVVDVVMEAKNVGKVEAVNLLAERFGFEGITARPKTSTNPAARPQNDNAPMLRSGEGPTVDQPLRGLVELQRLGMTGRVRIRERALEPVVYIWHGIAQAGQVVLLNGKPGEGKTTLLFLIIAARLASRPIKLLGLDITPAPPGQWVVLIEAEHGEASAARKLVKSCEALGLDDSGLDRVLVLARRDVKLGTPAWREVQEMARAGLVSDIAIDSLARFQTADSNSEEEQVAIFEEVHRVIEGSPEPHTTVWFVTHARKGGNGSAEDVSGSTQRTGQGDSVLNVAAERDATKRVVASKVTFPKLREEPDEWPGELRFVVARENGQWKCTVADAEGADETERMAGDVVRLLEDGPMTKTEIRDRLRVREVSETVYSLLFKQRRIARTMVERGNNRRQITAFQLAPRRDWRDGGGLGPWGYGARDVGEEAGE